MNAGGDAIGSVRFAQEGDRATISVSVAPEERGKGFGTALITAGCRRIFCTSPSLKEIEAFIKPANNASLSAFRKSGFSEPENEEMRGQPALRCVLDRTTLSL